MTISEFGKSMLKAISKALCTEECLKYLKSNYIMKDDFDLFGETK